MKKYYIYLIVFFLVITVEITSVLAIKVGPGGLTITGMPVGEKKDLGEPLEIFNDSKKEEIKFRITVLETQKAQPIWEMGYDEIPNPSWFFFEKDAVLIPAGESKKINMFLNIPDEEKYYNQHWCVFFTVRPEITRLFVAQVMPNYLVETKSKKNPKEPPYGKLGIAPTIIDVDGVLPGKNVEVSFTLYNNDSMEHTYKIYPMVPGKMRWDIVRYPGYKWLSDIKWLKKFNKTVRVKANSKIVISEKVKIPGQKFYSMGGLEALICVVPDKGIANFTRIHLNK